MDVGAQLIQLLSSSVKQAATGSGVLRYDGSGKDDFSKHLSAFEASFRTLLYKISRTPLDNKYDEKLATQQYKCHEFILTCTGGAKSTAEGLLKQATQRELDARRSDPHRAPPNEFFNDLIRAMKLALGPIDPLLYWLEQLFSVRLRVADAASFAAFDANITDALQRLMDAKGESRDNYAQLLESLVGRVDFERESRASEAADL